MKIKQRVGDFQVREQLADGVLQASGQHRVYRVTKRKLTSREAARILSDEAGVEQGQVAMCGWKDRQGITVQHMSVPRGRDVRMDSPELKIDSVGFAKDALDSDNSRGNAFEIRVRDLGSHELGILRTSLDVVRESGVVNYFDEQRFGNLKHRQGWIARDLMQNEHERALKSILAAPSPHDDERRGHFKARLRDAWGDWVQCLEVARRFREHHSIFEHLQRSPTDFAGGFEFVASRLRLIHLFAYQSHIWNRAVAERVAATVDVRERVVMYSPEGKLLSWAGREPIWAERRDVFRLPGPGLEDVTDPDEHAVFRDVLAKEGLVPDQFRIDGVPGFQLKGEDRPLILRPTHMRVRPRERDTENHDRWSVVVRFELPRGAYATLVVKRLFASPVGARPPRFDSGPREGGPRRGGGSKPWSGGGGGSSSGGGGARRSGAGYGGGSGGSWSGGGSRGDSRGDSRGRAGGGDFDRGDRYDRSRGEGSRGGSGDPSRAGSGGSERGGGWAPRRPNAGSDDRGRGQDSRGQGSRGQGARGQGWRGQDSREESWRGQDARGGGRDSREQDSRGNDSRGNDSRGNDSRGYGSGGNDSRNYGSRGQDSRGGGGDSGGRSWRDRDDRGGAGRGYGQEARGGGSRGSNFRGPGSRGDGYRGQGSRDSGREERGYQPRGNDRGGYQPRGNESRGNDSRGYQPRGNDSSRGNDSRGYQQRGNDPSRGNDSRGYTQRGNDRGNDQQRGNDAHGYRPRGNDAPRGGDARDRGPRDHRASRREQDGESRRPDRAPRNRDDE